MFGEFYFGESKEPRETRVIKFSRKLSILQYSQCHTFVSLVIGGGVEFGAKICIHAVIVPHVVSLFLPILSVTQAIRIALTGQLGRFGHQ